MKIFRKIFYINRAVRGWPACLPFQANYWFCFPGQPACRYGRHICRPYGG